jgi:hypothetical protein
VTPTKDDDRGGRCERAERRADEPEGGSGKRRRAIPGLRRPRGKLDAIRRTRALRRFDRFVPGFADCRRRAVHVCRGGCNVGRRRGSGRRRESSGSLRLLRGQLPDGGRGEGDARRRSGCRPARRKSGQVADRHRPGTRHRRATRNAGRPGGLEGQAGRRSRLRSCLDGLAGRSLLRLRRSRRRFGRRCSGRRGRGRRRLGGRDRRRGGHGRRRRGLRRWSSRGRRRSRGRRPRLRRGCGRRRCGRSRRWRLGHARRQEGERIEITVRIGGPADAEMDVGHFLLCRSGRPDRADSLPFDHARAAGDGDRAEVDEGDRVAVGRLDRDAEPVRRQRAGKRDHSRTHGGHGATALPGDVDATVLPGGVGVAPVAKARQDRSRRRPRPGPSHGREHEQDERHDDDRSQRRQHGGNRREQSSRCQSWLQFRHKERR